MLALYHGAISWINVAEQAPSPASVYAGSLVVVTGLELALADRVRRLTALKLLERYRARIDERPAGDRARLVILSETAPLERILDAYERDNTVDGERENLRWSQLFESFATYGFRQQRPTNGPLTDDDLEELDWRLDERDNHVAIETVLDEVRWLPHGIVNGGIGCELPIEVDALARGILPLPEAAHAALRPALIAWAATREFRARRPSAAISPTSLSNIVRSSGHRRRTPSTSSCTTWRMAASSISHRRSRSPSSSAAVSSC